MNCEMQNDRCEGPILDTLDPYAMEIDGEEVEITVCEYHYYEIAADI